MWVLVMVIVWDGSNENRLRVWEKVDWMVYHCNCKYRLCSIIKLFLKVSPLFNSEYYKIFKATILKNICERLRLKKYSWNWEELEILDKNFSSTLKNRIFQHQCQKQVKMYISLFLFHDWFSLEFIFTDNISLM